MTHSRCEFTSRARAPTDLYRRMFATLCAPARLILSRGFAVDQRALHLKLISPTITAINARGENLL